MKKHDASGSSRSSANDPATNSPQENAGAKASTPHKKHPAEQRQAGSSGFSRLFDRFATYVTKITGSPWAFIVALLIVLLWAVSGPIFNYSDTWQLVINTGTTIVTFLMVFVIQQSQNKDTMALQMKLNELIAANQKASNRLIDVEDLTEEELMLIKDYYIRLSAVSKKEKELQRSHSIEEMEKEGDTKTQKD